MISGDRGHPTDGPRRPSAEEHFRRLERLYLAAPTNAYYRPTIRIGEGVAEVVVAVREELFHAAHALHGSVSFKVLDDAAFFAVNSLVREVFVLTVSFSLEFLRPVASGSLHAHGRVVHSSTGLFVAEAEAIDDDGRLVAHGRGSFTRSRIELGPDVGYR